MGKVVRDEYTLLFVQIWNYWWSLGLGAMQTNHKVYCTYFSVEFWNMMLGNSSAILYSFYVGLGQCFHYFYAYVVCSSFTTENFTV